MIIKKIGFWIFVVVTLIIINDLVSSILSIWQKHELVDNSQKVLTNERKKNIELKKKLKTVSSTQFVEEEARNKLFLVKQGQEIVVVAPSIYLQSSSSTERKMDSRPNWQQWWEMFF